MARSPSHSPVRCWHALFASYCDSWQQQHGLLAFYAAPGGWLGAVRAGGLLTVLRRPSPAEVLLQESSPAVLEDVMQVCVAAAASCLQLLLAVAWLGNTVA